MSWRRITPTEPAELTTVLTQHEDDLYPVCAFRTSDGSWWREVEGPEDILRPGALDPLYRAPTHWQTLPISPLVEIEAALANPTTQPARGEA